MMLIKQIRESIEEIFKMKSRKKTQIRENWFLKYKSNWKWRSSERYDKSDDYPYENEK